MLSNSVNMEIYWQAIIHTHGRDITNPASDIQQWLSKQSQQHREKVW